MQDPVPNTPRRFLPVYLGLAALLLAVPALALHRDSGKAGRITRGGAHQHPSTRSWGHNLAFSSAEDLTNTLNTTRQIFVFNLLRYDCFRRTNTETACPAPAPYLTQATTAVGDPDNPSVDASGTYLVFDADGSFNGGTPGHRQIFLKNLITSELTPITSALMNANSGDSVKPTLNSPTGDGIARSVAFESTAPLHGGTTGVPQIFLYSIANTTLTQITNGAAASTAPMFTSDGSKFAFQSLAQLAGTSGPDQSAEGGAGSTSQIFWYDRNAGMLHPITQALFPSEHPYMTEKYGFVFFDSLATAPGSSGSGNGICSNSTNDCTTDAQCVVPVPGTCVHGKQVWSADIGSDPPAFMKYTSGPGDSTYPAVPDTVDRVAFVGTGDLLANESGCETQDCPRRLFVRLFARGGGNITLGTLKQVTARGEIFPPIAANLGQWFVSLATTDDMEGIGVCEPQLHVVDYFDKQPGHYPSTSTLGQKPTEPPVGNMDNGCNDENGCTTDACTAGQCHNPAKSDGQACDTTTCVKAGTCSGGECLVSLPACDDNNGCTVDGCDPTFRDPAPNSTVGCFATPVPNCKPCVVAADCDDANSCTTDTCVNGGCLNAQKDFGAPCSTSLCVTGETCDLNGVCGGGAAKNCHEMPNDDTCTTDTCDASNGACVHALQDNCRPCTPGTVGTDCDDGNPCTVKSCVNSFCQQNPLVEGTDCSDQNPCHGGRICNDGGACVPDASNPPPDCSGGCNTGTCIPNNQTFSCVVNPNCTPCQSADQCPGDANPCHTVSCTNGACATSSLPNNTACSDGNACNGIERCVSGACTAGPPPNCDDHIDCTVDACNPAQGCVHVGNSSACDDGSPCTTDTCSPSQGCKYTPHPSACDDGNPCTDDVCAEGTGCGHLARPNNTPCGPGDGCTRFPVCQNGICVGGPGDGTCADADPCTIDTCTTAGCRHDQPGGFDGVFCRLGELEQLMSEPPLRRGLAGLVATAGRHVERAQVSAANGAVHHLGIAEGKLRKFIAQLIRGNGNVSRLRAVQIAQKARDVLRPLHALRADYAALARR